MAPQRDRSKLPKWAQDEIERLERHLAQWKARAEVGPEESNTFAHAYSDAPTPLGHDTVILFVTTSGKRFHVRLERNRTGAYENLNVNADDGIAVYPDASNCVTLQSMRRP